MTHNKLLSLVANGESETLEFKESFGDEALEAIGAFSNAQGGTVLVGVADNGDLKGLQAGKKSLEDIANRIQQGTDPRLQPSITSYELAKNRVVIMIRAATGTGVPVAVRGRYFRRVGKTNQLMSHEEIRQRMLESGRLSWDAGIEETATWADLSDEKVAQFVDAVRKTGRQPIPQNADGKDVLEKLNLSRGGKLTRASVLLFGRNPRHFTLSAHVKVGRFRSPTLIVDDRHLEGTLFDQVDQTMLWFRETLKTKFVITGKPQRDVVWEYPLEAIREGIINAICHRSYVDVSSIQVRLYDDCLEIWNPGGLAHSLKAADLLQKHKSVPRNPLIADAFFFAGLIENWGTGTLRMAAMLKDAGLPEPSFETAQSDTFGLKFFAGELILTRLRELGLNDRQIRAIEVCKSEGKMTNILYQETFSVSKRTATTELKTLTDLDVFEKHGKTGKGTFYGLKPKGSAGA